MKLVILMFLIFLLPVVTAKAEITVSKNNKSLEVGKINITSSTPLHFIKGDEWGYKKAGYEIVKTKEPQLIVNESTYYMVCVENKTTAQASTDKFSIRFPIYDCINYTKTLMNEFKIIDEQTSNISFFGGYDPNPVTWDGSNCGNAGGCYINSTDNYMVKLERAGITEWFDKNGVQVSHDNSLGSQGSIYGNTWESGPSSANTFTCTNVSGLDDRIELNCAEASNHANFTFFEKYINAKFSNTAETFRVYAGMGLGGGYTASQAVVFNSTTFYVPINDVWTAFSTSLGQAVMGFNDSNNTFVFDVPVAGGTAASDHHYKQQFSFDKSSIAWGRASEFATGSTVEIDMRFYTKNTSASGDEQWLSILRCFMNNHNSTDDCSAEEPGEDPCAPPAAGTWNITEDCNITSAKNIPGDIENRGFLLTQSVAFTFTGSNQYYYGLSGSEWLLLPGAEIK